MAGDLHGLGQRDDRPERVAQQRVRAVDAHRPDERAEPVGVGVEVMGTVREHRGLPESGQVG